MNNHQPCSGTVRKSGIDIEKTEQEEENHNQLHEFLQQKNKAFGTVYSVEFDGDLCKNGNIEWGGSLVHDAGIAW